MAFTMTLAFATEHDRDSFLERTLPRTRAHQVDVPGGAPPEEPDGMYRLSVAVTSPSAARDLCHHIVAFLAHAKNTRVDVQWTGTDGQPQVGEVNAGTGREREAEILAMRVGSAAKAHLEAERAEPPAGEPEPPAGEPEPAE